MEHSFQTQEKQATPTRERVIEAAAELFATHGYAGTSISAIRKASGVLPSSIYWEFGSKEGIFAAVLEDAAARWLKQSARAVMSAMQERGGSGPDILLPYFDYMAEALADPPEWLRLSLLVAVERREGDERSLEIVRAQRRRAIDALSRFFVAAGLVKDDPVGQRAQDMARMIVACFDGAFAAAQLDSTPEDLRRMLRLLYAAIRAIPQVE